MKNFFTLIILIFSLSVKAQNVSTVLNDIENFKIVTLSNGFKVQIITSEEYEYCNCRLTVDISDISEGEQKGIKSITAALTGSELIGEELLVKNMISHNQALDSLMEFMAETAFSPEEKNITFNEYKSQRQEYLRNLSADKESAVSDLASTKCGIKLLPKNYLDNIFENDYKEFKKRCFTAGRCLLTIISNMEVSQIQELAEKHFGKADKNSQKGKAKPATIPAQDLIYFINDSLQEKTICSFRNYFPCQKTPKNYIFNKLAQQIIYGEYAMRVRNFSTLGHEIYSLNLTTEEDSNFDSITKRIFKFRGSESQIEAQDLEEAKKLVIENFKNELKSPAYATEIASHIILYKFQNNYFSNFEGSINMITETEMNTFIDLINKNGSNVLASLGQQRKHHCSLLKLAHDRKVELGNLQNEVSFTFDKGFTAQNVLDKYLVSSGLNNPPKNYTVTFKTVYDYLDKGVQYTATGRILRKTPNMYSLENYVVHEDSMKIFHYKEMFDGNTPYDSTMLYGREEVDTIREKTLIQKAYFPLEAYYDKLGIRFRLSCDYDLFQQGLFKVETFGLNNEGINHYFNIQNGLRTKTELLSDTMTVKKIIEYTYDEYNKYKLPKIIRETSKNLVTEILFSIYDFNTTLKKANFFIYVPSQRKK